MKDFSNSYGRGSGMRVNGQLKRLRSKLKSVAQRGMKPLTACLEQEARMVAISCAKSCQPYGKSEPEPGQPGQQGTGIEAKQMGEMATIRDIRRVYVSAAQVFKMILLVKNQKTADAFWHCCITGEIEKARGVMNSCNLMAGTGTEIGQFDGGAAHAACRNPQTGRVNPNQTPRLIVIDGARLEEYIAHEMGFVGFAKAAWANVARAFGGIRGLRNQSTSAGERDITAGWILRHRNAPFFIRRMYGNPWNPVVHLASRVRYGKRLLTDRARARATEIAYERLLKNARIALAYELKKMHREKTY